MDYFVTKENYTNRGHWARARHVSEVKKKNIFTQRFLFIYFFFLSVLSAFINSLCVRETLLFRRLYYYAGLNTRNVISTVTIVVCMCVCVFTLCTVASVH